MTEENKTDEIPAGYLKNNKGHFVPENLVKPQELLEDQMVGKILGYAEELSDRIARFKGHTNDDILTFLDILSEKYGAKKGGKKGNITFYSYDGLKKVQVAINDFISFGAELQIAKDLIDDYLRELVTDAPAEIAAIVNEAFQVDKAGKVNVQALLRLRRVEIDNDTWRAAMSAITDSIRVDGSKQYFRFYTRPAPEGRWQPITVDLAKA